MTTPLPTPPLAPPARTGNTAFAITIALLLLRLTLGWTFFFHGTQHALAGFDGPGIDGFAKSLAAQPLPKFLSPTAWASIAAYGELLGGISVFLGLLTRLGALPIIATMLVAIANVHGPHGFSAQNGGYEYNLLIIAVSLALLIAGPGLISLDALLFHRGLWARGPQPLSQPQHRAQP